MSPTPVRDALGRLRQEGLVTSRGDRGFEVAPMLLSDIRELAELRWIVESGIMRVVISRSTPEEIDRLRPLADAGGETGTDDATRIAANRAFHLAVAALSQNKQLVRTLSQVFDASERFFYLGIGGLPRDKMLHIHTDILDALMAKDEKTAVELCSHEAFDNSERVVQALIESAVNPQGRFETRISGAHGEIIARQSAPVSAA